MGFWDGTKEPRGAPDQKSAQRLVEVDFAGRKTRGLWMPPEPTVGKHHLKSTMWQKRESRLDSQKVSYHIRSANRTTTNQDKCTANRCHN
ncbi:MAG: hypothetical protein C0473_01855 [Cyanobacteria bacterium DS3.002]|nr:hypothetical protein [Cyanobacteria bacterium DS3.002]MBA4049667.1 hypothetical protein [Cyanobacteria bacterium DS2.008]